jgi:Arc/MetJ-type ribon-helix-helix transcriptional regulator
MSVHLTPELEKRIEQKVESGRYSSANDVVSEALRLLDERPEDSDASPSTGTKPTAKFGSAKGRVFIADDFDAPLEEFEEYT